MNSAARRRKAEGLTENARLTAHLMVTALAHSATAVIDEIMECGGHAVIPRSDARAHLQGSMYAEVPALRLVVTGVGAIHISPTAYAVDAGVIEAHVTFQIAERATLPDAADGLDLKGPDADPPQLLRIDIRDRTVALKPGGDSWKLIEPRQGELPIVLDDAEEIIWSLISRGLGLRRRTASNAG